MIWGGFHLAAGQNSIARDPNEGTNGKRSELPRESNGRKPREIGGHLATEMPPYVPSDSQEKQLGGAQWSVIMDNGKDGEYVTKGIYVTLGARR